MYRYTNKRINPLLFLLPIRTDRPSGESILFGIASVTGAIKYEVEDLDALIVTKISKICWSRAASQHQKIKSGSSILRVLTNRLLLKLLLKVDGAPTNDHY